MEPEELETENQTLRKMYEQAAESEATEYYRNRASRLGSEPKEQGQEAPPTFDERQQAAREAFGAFGIGGEGEGPQAAPEAPDVTVDDVISQTEDVLSRFGVEGVELDEEIAQTIADPSAIESTPEQRAGALRRRVLGRFTGGLLGKDKTAEDFAQSAALEGAQKDEFGAHDLMADIGEGITEIPAQTWNVAVNAFNETVDLVYELNDWQAKYTNFNPTFYVDGNGDGKWLNDTGIIWLESANQKYQEELLRSGQVSQFIDFGRATLQSAPKFAEADSATGRMYEATARFVFGFVGAGKLKVFEKLEKAGRSGKTAAAMGKGFLADFTVFDGNEGRLADVLDDVPVLKEIVPDYLAGSEDDEELEGRFKNAVEGLGLGLLAEGVILGLKQVRAKNKAKIEAQRAVQEAQRAAGEPVQSLEELDIEAADMAAERDLLFLGTIDPARQPNGPARQSIVDQARRIFATTADGANDQLIEDLKTGVTRAQTPGEALLEIVKSLRKLKPRRPKGSKQTQISKPVAAASGRRLAAWIQHKGGMNLNDEFVGEVIGRVGGTKRRVGLFTNSGKKPEALYEEAIENGYISADSSFDDFAEAVGRDVNGEEIWSRFDQDYVEAKAEYDQTVQRFEKSYRGLNLGDGDDDILRYGDSDQNPDLPLWQQEQGRGVRVDINGRPDPVYINMNRVDLQNSEKTVMQQIADQFGDEITEQVSDNSAMLQAIDIDGFAALRDRRAGQPLSKAETVAARLVWHASGKALGAAFVKLDRNPDSPALRFAVNRQIAMHRAIQKEILGARADASRSLNAWAINLGDGGRLILNDLKARLQSMGDDTGVLAKDKSTEIDSLRAKMAALLDEAGELTPGKASELINDKWGRKLADSFVEVWRNFLLTGAQTHVINVVGNTVFLGRDIIDGYVSGFIAKAVGDEVSAGMMKEAAESFQGVTSALKDMMVYTAKTKRLESESFARRAIGGREPVLERLKEARQERPFVTAGPNQYDEGMRRSISSEYWNVPSKSVTGAALDYGGALINLPQTFLGGMDTFYKTLSHRGELHSLAGREVRERIARGDLDPQDYQRAVQDIIENPSRQIQEAAEAMARRRTFTNETGPLTNSIKTMRERARPFGLPIGHFLLPFVNTPSNLLRESYRRGLTGLSFGGFRDQLAAGGYEGYKAASQLALGTGVLMLGIDMANNGLITGSGPANQGQRDAWAANGKLPYAIKIGDTWVQYNRFDPMVGQLALGADMAEVFANNDWTGENQDTAAEMGIRAAFMVGNTLNNRTYFTGLSDFVNAMSDPSRRAEDWTQGFAGSFVPSVVGATERAVDPEYREAWNIFSAVKGRIPWASEDLPASLDVWGRPRTAQSGLGEIYDFLSPFAARKVDPEPIDQEIMNLRLPLRRTQRTISVLGTNVSLKNRPDIYNAIVEDAGPRAREYLNQVITGKHSHSQAYMEADPWEKRAYIKGIVSDSYRQARKDIMEEGSPYRNDILRMAAKRDAQLMQLSEEEYMAMNERFATAVDSFD